MSVPLRDPNFTMKDLQDVGYRLTNVALEYWEAAHKAGVEGAIIWVSGPDGLVIFTRSEYRAQLLANIERISPTVHFGHTTE